MQRPFVAVLLCAVLLAGCSDSPGPVEVEVAPGQLVTVSEAPKPTHGIVAGLVGDDALYPLANATIWVLGLNRSTTTDGSGRFALINVPAGVYILEGSKKDHATVQTTADVVPGETARAVLLLQRLPSTDPYHVIPHQEAFVEFRTVGLSLNSDNTTLPFRIDDVRARTVVLESAWEGIIQSTEERPLLYELADNDGRVIVTDRAANPFSVHVDARVLDPTGNKFRFTVGPDALDPTVMAQASGDLFVTVFYNQPARTGWSILSGDA